jgi:5-methyltetrahydrofolate--homocysteine methyltransferase
MKLKEFAETNIITLDGAMGTMLQQRGVKPGEDNNILNITAAALVESIHREYVESGADLILTNTFGANARKLAKTGYAPGRVIEAAAALSKRAAAGRAYVALEIGPIGEMLSPAGALSFDDAYALFAEQVRAGAEADLDAIYIETMTDLGEARCAVLAAKENCDLPVFCTMSFDENGRTFMGVPLASAASTLSGLGADFIGVNCSVGPAMMVGMAKELMKWTDAPIAIKPNAGIPRVEGGETLFDVDEDEFAGDAKRLLDLGVAAVGGCCGTTPAYIARLANLARGYRPVKRGAGVANAVCSASGVARLDSVRVVGERINPTGKPRLQRALANGDMDYVAALAVEQTESGADILDINVSCLGADEKSAMRATVKNLQAVCSAPLQIDSSNPVVIEEGLRAFHGKAIINSANGDPGVLAAVLPLARKYGAAVIGLTLSRSGIPKTAEERFAVAEKIVDAAVSRGISKRDVIIDVLTLSAGAEQAYAYETLNALRLVKERLGVKTTLGVSNISFGLPGRKYMNRTFLALALANGLDLPIINPNESDMADTMACFRQLKNIDENSAGYVRRFAPRDDENRKAAKKYFGADKKANNEENNNINYNGDKNRGAAPDIESCVAKGLKNEIQAATAALLEKSEPMEVVNKFLIPALDAVGSRYEREEIFLPQLLRCAEAAKSAFEVVRAAIPEKTAAGDTIILATVKGDIHDIGKNIARSVLENYGYTIIDLGRDVDAETIVEAAVKHGSRLVGLSALMTTTVSAMEETIRRLKSLGGVQVMVGGAVLTPEYAGAIGADFYAKDAIAGVAIAKGVFS